MLNIIYAELLKLKKTYITIAILIGGTIMTLIMALARLISEKDMEFEKYIYNIEQVNYLMLFVVLFPLIAGYVFSREYSDKTASTLYSYPISRMEVFMAKYFTVNILIFLVYALQTLSMPLSFYFLHGNFPEGQLIITDLKASLLSMFFQFLIIPIPILIANLSKNIMFPIVYGMLGFITTIVVGGNDTYSYSQYYPIASPYFSTMYINSPERINFSLIMIINLMCFILFMSLCIYEFSKKDII